MNYLGGKNGAGVYQTIINLIPPHDTYIEPFLGTGAVLLKKAPANKNIAIDLDPELIAYLATRLKNYGEIQLITEDAIQWLERYEPKDKTVIYCDPPYVHNTRTSNKRYKYELTDDDHRRLLTILKNIDAHVLISGYRNAIYDDYISNWWSIDFQTMSHGGVRTETIWCNFQPGEIHYHTYAGKNFTDRQRIKRKAERWAKNYQALPPQEQQAIFAAMCQLSQVN